KSEQAATYEPMQLRVLAVQARAALVQARNRYTAAWKQLAASLGLPALPPTELVGRVDMPLPAYQFEEVLARVLNTHTDVATAQNTLERARYNLRLAQVTPIPDVDVRVVVQKDNTGVPKLIQYGIQTGIQLPVWDKNRGNILQAEGQLLRATEEAHRVRSDLSSRLAEAFERYANNRSLLGYYSQYILPDQVRAYRAVYERHQQEPDKVGFADVVSAQQTLAAVVTAYVTTLGATWTAVTDVANLLQTNDLFQTGQEHVTPVPDLERLGPLPCCHPCSPLPDPGLKGGDGTWPRAAP